MIVDGTSKSQSCLNTGHNVSNHVTFVYFFLVDILIKLKQPVSLNVKKQFNLTIIELFIHDEYPILKFIVNECTLQQGRLGKLMESQDVPKVFGRLDLTNVQKLFDILSGHGIRINQVVDICTLQKVVNYWLYGQSIFRTSSPTFKQHYRIYGLDVEINQILLNLMILLHLQQVLPPDLLTVAFEKCRIEADIAASICLPEAKVSKTKLRQDLEDGMIHVECIVGKSSRLEAALKTFLDAKSIPYERLQCFGRYAFIRPSPKVSLPHVIHQLESADLDGLRILASEVGLKMLLHNKELRTITKETLKSQMDHTLNELEKENFHQVINKNQVFNDDALVTADKFSHSYKTLFHEL